MNDSRQRRLFGAAGRHLAETPVKLLLWEAKRTPGGGTRARQCAGAVLTENRENATDELRGQHWRGVAVLHGWPRG